MVAQQTLGIPLLFCFIFTHLPLFQQCIMIYYTVLGLSGNPSCCSLEPWMLLGGAFCLALCWCLGMLNPLRVSGVLLGFRWVFGLLMLSSPWMIDWVPTDSLCGFGKEKTEFGGWGYRLWAQKWGEHIPTVLPSVPMSETISVWNSSPMSFSLWHHDCKSTKGPPGFAHGTLWLLPVTFPSWIMYVLGLVGASTLIAGTVLWGSISGGCLWPQMWFRLVQHV